MIARATELAMEESLRVFIDVRQSLFAHNIRMEDITWDLFSGTVNAWALRSATVPADPVTGLRTSKILNLEMFLDGWNPWVSPGWLYDSVQRTQMIDEGTDPHPHTGRYIDWRNIVTVETAGPEGTLAVPSDALEWDGANSVWMEVGSGVTAKSKVTSDIILGSWHHGPDLTMQDVLYSWSNFWRRCVGDINATAGLTLACDPSVQIYERDILVAIKPLDDDTMEVYINYWHVDDREIAATGEAGLPSVP
ncbi:MAG: hypothetical protein GTO63_00700, partial [Anaerolineae bacterium]|nr:hypothetical protein [Anaerolineae bacterium]NIN93527.1 hypothetical protein [Anaerolineae bacterium]